jgi:hypothetical protein
MKESSSDSPTLHEAIRLFHQQRVDQFAIATCSLLRSALSAFKARSTHLDDAAGLSGYIYPVPLDADAK